MIRQPRLEMSLIAALFACAGACGSSVGDTNCTPQGCGTNSPVLSNSTYFETMNLDGVTWSEDPVRYVKQSFRCTSQPQLGPLDLYADDGELFGIDDAGSRVCAGADLVDATFEIVWRDKVDGKAVGPENPTTITIEAIDSVSTWHRDPLLVQVVPTYRFGWSHGDFCPKDDATWMDPEQVVRGVKVPPAGQDWHTVTRHALILQGETYDQRANVLASGAGWINIGCVGAAFAKMRLLGLDPATGTSQPGDRTATLKMITARYDPDDSRGVSHTVWRMPLAWRSLGGTRYYGEIDDAELGPIEALWTPGGAICVSHGRLWQQGSSMLATNESHLLERWGANTNCRELETMSGVEVMHREALPDSVPPAVVWATVTVDHVAHLMVPTGSP